MPMMAARSDGELAMHRARSRRPSRFQSLLVALAALGLMIGVRPAALVRGHLALTPSTFAPIADLAANLNPASTPIEPEEGPSLSARAEDGSGEDADEAIDSAWTDLGLAARAGRLHRHASPPITFPPEPARPARPVLSRSGHPPDPHASPIPLPIRLCRWTC